MCILYFMYIICVFGINFTDYLHIYVLKEFVFARYLNKINSFIGMFIYVFLCAIINFVYIMCFVFVLCSLIIKFRGMYVYVYIKSIRFYLILEQNYIQISMILSLCLCL